VSKQLGKGYFSTVHLATHTQTNTLVAIKVLNKLKLREMYNKLWRELVLHKSLQHQHVIQMYEDIEDDKEILVVMEYAQGRELFEYLVASGRLQEHEAKHIFQQIISAIEYCHRKGVAHRDLKPENILLDELGNVKIADFGLSNTLRDGFFLRTSCGSPNYAAPEIFMDA
jgi:5'-AMP-activated protein kinase catalytic alpha subunit